MTTQVVKRCNVVHEISTIISAKFLQGDQSPIQIFFKRLSNQFIKQMSGKSLVFR